MKFIDVAKIYIKSGSGGAGAVSFRREKFVPFGGPDGGNGGKGGSVIFQATKNLNTLLDFKYISRYIAKNGAQGAGQRSTGADGQDCIVKVPVGTIVKDFETGETLIDIDEDGKQVTLLKGGRGGKGNDFFKSATNQTPKKSQPGEPGEEREVVLELKLLADIGLLGMPNAGKSTFISRVSAAKPKIADYPFTTLVPNLGVVKGDIINSFVIADIPGIIEGAHSGKGLGIQFLRHVERTKVLLHVLDHIGKDFETIINEYNVINNEIASYKSELSGKRQIVAINKVDVPLDEELENELKSYFEKEGREVFFISSVAGINMTEILRSLQKALV